MADIVGESGAVGIDEAMSASSGGEEVACILEASSALGEGIHISRLVRVSGGFVRDAYCRNPSRAALVCYDLSGFDPRENIFTIVRDDIGACILNCEPSFISRSDVPQELVREKEAEARRMLAGTGLSGEALCEAVADAMEAFFAASCLYEHTFDERSGELFGKVIEKTAKRLRGKFSVSRFVRFNVAEDSYVDADDNTSFV